MVISTKWIRSLVFASVALAASSVHANRYVIVDLGEKADPNMIGRSGVIAGTSNDSGQPMQWRGGHWHALSDYSGEALAVNSRGETVGYDLGRFMGRPIVWSRKGVARYLKMPFPSNSGTGAAIADDGTAAGWYRAQNGGQPLCFRESADGDSIDLKWPGSACYVTGMNNAGQIIGHGGQNGRRVAFVWQGGQFKALDILSGDTGAYSLGINDCGVIVGQSDTGTTARAVIWRKGGVARLDKGDEFASSIAFAINHRSDIVGLARRTPAGSSIAVRFAGGRAITLASEVEQLGDWTLHTAYSVNDQGIIVGRGERSGVNHAFALVPLHHVKADDQGARPACSREAADAQVRR